MTIKKPLTGLFAFLIVLILMPLGHAIMILMEEIFGHEYVFASAIVMGVVGLLFLILGLVSKSDNKATFWGLFSGLFIWTGWIEFSFVYYSSRYEIPPLMENGEIVTKPEYLLMPSSLPFLAVFLIYYFFGTKTGCTFFNWIQKKSKATEFVEYKAVKRPAALTTMMEMIMLLWTFYLLLLFAYDDHFFGDRHPITYVIAFGSLFWSIWLFNRLLKVKSMGYALRYAIPTVIIFWNFVEIMGRWDLLNEIWVQPLKYGLELALMTGVFVALVAVSLIGRKKAKKVKH